MPATEPLSVYRAQKVTLGVPKFIEAVPIFMGSPNFYDTSFPVPAQAHQECISYVDKVVFSDEAEVYIGQNADTLLGSGVLNMTTIH